MILYSEKLCFMTTLHCMESKSLTLNIKVAVTMGIYIFYIGMDVMF